MASASLVFGARHVVNLIQPSVLSHIRSSLCARNYRSLGVSLHLCRKYSDAADKGRFYSKKHEWVEVDGNTGTIGISHYAQEALGDVVYAQLPEVGTDVERDEEVGALESVKAASELYSPVSGNISSVNKEVEQSPGIINQSCYEKGWLFKLTFSKTEELDDLMTENQYQAFLKIEEAAK